MGVPKRIVLVEDDRELANTIVEFLNYHKFEVKWLQNGREAMIYLKENSCDLIISDLMMPVLGGDELFMQMRKNLQSKAIPFIMITAQNNDVVKFQQLDNGVHGYITKPFLTKELLYKINTLLEFKEQILMQSRPDPFSKVTIKLTHKDFISSLNSILSENIKYKADQLALAYNLNMSKSTLDKKIRKLTTKNTSKYIREFKLDYAIKMLDMGERNIQFIADETGFQSISYFSSSFKNYLGKSPSKYIAQIELI